MRNQCVAAISGTSGRLSRFDNISPSRVKTVHMCNSNRYSITRSARASSSNVTATCTILNTNFSMVQNFWLERNCSNAPAEAIAPLSDVHGTRVEYLDLPYLVGTSGEFLCPDDDLAVRVRLPEHPRAGLGIKRADTSC